jgi:hypothetical protein
MMLPHASMEAGSGTTGVAEGTAPGNRKPRPDSPMSVELFELKLRVIDVIALRLSDKKSPFPPIKISLIPNESPM